MTTEREQLVADLRKVANIILAYPEIPVDDIRVTGTGYLFSYDDETRAQSKTVLARMAKSVKRHLLVDKQYTGSTFELRLKPRKDSRVRLIFYTSRDTVCERKVVGTEYVPPMEGYTREIVEWDCKEPLLKGAE